MSFRVNDGDSSYVLYESTERLPCFECGDIGHKRFSCLHKNRPEEPWIREEQEVENEATMESQGDQSQEPEKVSEGQSVDTGEENEVSTISTVFLFLFFCLQEEHPCCSSKIGLKAAAQDVVYDEVLSVSQHVKVVTVVEDVVSD